MAAEPSRGTTRMILYAAARVLGCGSAQLALLDRERHGLVFTTSIINRELQRLAEVESALGFPLEGAMLPLSATNSSVVRAFAEERLVVTSDVADLAGGVVPDAVVEIIRASIGPRTFAAVPVVARSGIAGVLLFEKRGDAGFSAEDRDLLVAYADRVGASLESQALSDDAQRLEALAPSPSGTPAPTLLVCDRALHMVGSHDGRALGDVYSVAESALLDVALPVVESGEPSTATLRTTQGKLLRLTLARGPGELLLVATEDVDESEELRREVARTREHLTKVLRSVGDAILTLDGDGRVTSVSDAVGRVFGVDTTALVGQDSAALCADDKSRRRAVELRRKAWSTGFAEGELRFSRGDGTRFPAEVSALLIADGDEQPAGVVWRVHDLTERRRGDAEQKRLRERLLHTERLSALGEMAARIAHEVRNPLVSIGAAAQVVAEELGDGSPVFGEVLAIGREVRRLDAIVSDFLRFARPPRPELRSVELGVVLQETVELARKKGGPIELSADSPLVARCDPDGVKQVLLNVLLNAIEAAPGTLVECEARAFAGEVVLTVTDRGPGIPDSARRRVFNPFFSTKTRGTGLGLAVSKQIIDEHRGRIRLVPRPGGGTRVVIELPIG